MLHHNANEVSPSMASAPNLDATDIKLLTELQDNGRITNNELAFRGGISPPNCLRRIRALRDRGVIKGVRALVDLQLLNYDIVFFAMIQLHSQVQLELAEFERFVRTQIIVRESWLLSGDIDYILKCVAHDLSGFRSFVSALTLVANVRRIRTSLALRNIKDAALVPFMRL
jgi:DNA-binding Lrp family transcriptional regulator